MLTSDQLDALTEPIVALYDEYAQTVIRDIARMYMNGNLHLEFKRPDLVTQINKIGGNGAELAGGVQ